MANQRTLTFLFAAGKNRLQRQIVTLYSHLTDWDPGDVVEIRRNRNTSSGRAAHSCGDQQAPTPIVMVSRPLAATEQRPTPERFDSRHRINPYPLYLLGVLTRSDYVLRAWTLGGATQPPWRRCDDG
jgi:hypothetical protein